MDMKLPNGTTLNPTTPLVDVFVYGTLKVGRELSGGLDAYRISSQEATTRGVLYRGRSYPMMVKSHLATDIVRGEVHRYPSQVLSILDSIEGYSEKNPDGSLFVRQKIPVYLTEDPHPHSQDIYAYLWKRQLEPGHYPIHSGEWFGRANLICFGEDYNETGDLT